MALRMALPIELADLRPPGDFKKEDLDRESIDPPL
eukprot:CAMPEP_0201676862 /NCGR_PEP_ID=MMETSP0494-20130426/42780_1 /ASSEMBLY_ACC=CAM_ASM_000839 /TAXON_ID=420259 /ORGANISM="Thalassiosira gravida, Strain GMp14c1" /LENGTH=34 /DNA_ID= /DNA_START= /DNA_END= /DNA_ORIENTATION=